MDRVLNFYPGPSALPQEVLEEVRDEMLDWAGTGMSVLETSHRSKEYDRCHNETIELLKDVFSIPENFKVLLLQGGATLQFAMIPLNLLGEEQSADYIVTGNFSKNAFTTASIIRKVKLAASTEENGKYFRIPRQNELKLDSKAMYCHITSNNTIFGTQWKDFPETGGVPIVVDMSSDILSRKIDFSPFGIVYAGAQKNLGPAGVTVVVIRDDLIERSKVNVPDILSYKTHVSKNSLFNTPNCFGIYVIGKVLKWVKKNGSLDFIEKRNRKKAELLYKEIDSHPEFFRTRVEKESRSFMNAVFNLPSEELEKKFVEEAVKRGIIGVKGHRSVGGIRVSMYNAHGVESIEHLVQFMEDFVASRG